MMPMHSVVNHLPIKADANWAEMAAKFDTFAAGIRRTFPKIRAAQLLKVSDAEAIAIVLYEDLATMRRVSSDVAAPWFAENIRPYLAAPVSRSVGEMIAGFA
jgi:hypothetical protein